jgi:tripartite ATP-independent transporter DctM subunit
MGYIALKNIMKSNNDIIIEPSTSLKEKLVGLKNLLPLIAIMTGIIGSIYTGLATATEAAGLGVLGALLLSLFQKCLSWKTFWESLLAASQTTAMIALILMGSSLLSMTMGFTGLPSALAEWIGSYHLSVISLILCLTIFYVVLGMFLDGISSIVLTMAVVQPMVAAAGIDMIWFGIFIVVLVEMAQITPPIGFNLFVMQKITNKDLPFIARAALPMFFIMLLMVTLLVIFPNIATWLPNLM